MGDGTYRNWRFRKVDEHAILEAIGYKGKTFEKAFDEVSDNDTYPGIVDCSGENSYYEVELATAKIDCDGSSKDAGYEWVIVGGKYLAVPYHDDYGTVLPVDKDGNVEPGERDNYLAYLAMMDRWTDIMQAAGKEATAQTEGIIEWDGALRRIER